MSAASWILFLALCQDPIELKTTDNLSAPQIRLSFTGGAATTNIYVQRARLRFDAASAGYFNLSGAGTSTTAGDLWYAGGSLVYYNTAARTVVNLDETQTLTNKTLGANSTWNGNPIGVGYGGTGSSTTFTSGSVIFAGSSGVYSQDNANLYWDDTANHLYVGTNSPTLGRITSLTSTDGGYGLFATNSSTGTGTQVGVYGRKTGATGTGIGYGVDGSATGSGNFNVGVRGFATEASTNYGVYGVTPADGGYGVVGLNNSTGTGSQFGVFGTKSGDTGTGIGYGVKGAATGTGAVNYGVFGEASGATTNYAGYFSGDVLVTGTLYPGTLSLTSGLTVTGGAVNLNASSNFPVNIATGTSTGAVTIGGTAGQTINIAGTGSIGADVINIGTGGTAADTINIGNLTGATTLTFTSGATTQNAMTINVDDLTTGTGLYILGPGLGSGFAGELIRLKSTGMYDSSALLYVDGDVKTAAHFDVASGIKVMMANENLDYSNTVYGVQVDLNETYATAFTTNLYGFHSDVNDTTSSTGDKNLYGGRFGATKWNATAGTTNVYGIYATASGETGGISTAYGIYATASGADTNWAGYFSGAVRITNGMTVSGATINLNDSSNAAVNIATGTSTGTVTIGGSAAKTIHIAGTGATAADVINIGTGGGSDVITLGTSAATVNHNSAGATWTMTGANSMLFDSVTDGATLSLGTSNFSRTINIGTGTAADTVNIATGGTTADAVTIGNTGVATTFTVNSGASTSTALMFVLNSISSGTGVSLSATGITSGSGLSLVGRPSGANFTGSLLSATSYMGSAAKLVNLTGTVATAGASDTAHGIYVDLANAPTANGNLVYGVYSRIADSTTTARANQVYGLYGSVSDSTASTILRTNYGGYFTATKTGAATGSDKTYGAYASATKTGTLSGTVDTYGLYATATGDTGGTSTAYGIYATASGADTNYAGYFDGNVGVSSGNTTGNAAWVQVSSLTSGTGLFVSGPTSGATFVGNLIKAESTGMGPASRLLYLTGTVLTAGVGESAGAVFVDLTNSPTANDNTARGIYTRVTDTTTARANTNQGLYTEVSDTTASTVTRTNYAGYFTATKTGTSLGTVDTYGLYSSATGDSGGTSTAYGIYATASGADTNWAGYFSGSVNVTSDLNVGGNLVSVWIDTARITVNGGGLASSPEYTFDNDSNTGMWRPMADNLAFATGGSEVMRLQSDGTVSVGTSSDHAARLYVVASGATPLAVNRTGNDGELVGFYQSGNLEGGITVSGTLVSYNGFTGSHYAWSPSGREFRRGEVLVATGNNQTLYDRPAGQGETVYGVDATSRRKDPRAMGVYCDMLTVDHRKGTQLIIVNAVGDGFILVTDTGGDIEVGDYLTTSNREGYAENQGSPLMANYTLAKAMQRVRWADEQVDPKRGFKWKLIACTFRAG